MADGDTAEVELEEIRCRNRVIRVFSDRRVQWTLLREENIWRHEHPINKDLIAHFKSKGDSVSWGIAESIKKYEEDTEKKVSRGTDIAALYDQETERELAKEVENRIEEALSADVWKSCTAAARGGHLERLKHLHESGCPWDERACAAAARGGHLECLKYLHENGCPWDERACLAATEGGHLECLKYLHENGCPWDERACAAAAWSGHLECLKYLHENGCPWDRRACAAAAGGGHLECMKYLHENGCPWNQSACAAPTFWGHLECLKYLHENECPWNERTCEAAASSGRLECLKYAHENGCPWDEETCAAAAEGGNLECLKYAHENGCPMFGDDRYHEIMQLYENGQIYGDEANAVRSYLESIRGPIGCPIEFVMAKLDEVATNIPEQTYIEMSRALMRAHGEKKRRRPNQ